MADWKSPEGNSKSYIVDQMETSSEDWHETLYRAYLNWTPHRTLAASLDYQFEDFNADGDETRPPDTATHLLSANLRISTPLDFSVS